MYKSQFFSNLGQPRIVAGHHGREGIGASCIWWPQPSGNVLDLIDPIEGTNHVSSDPNSMSTLKYCLLQHVWLLPFQCYYLSTRCLLDDGNCED
jgi:hypothetical protein